MYLFISFSILTSCAASPPIGALVKVDGDQSLWSCFYVYLFHVFNFKSRPSPAALLSSAPLTQTDIVIFSVLPLFLFTKEVFLHLDWLLTG